MLRTSSESAVTSRPNGESMPMLTVEELERKLRGQTKSDVESSSLPVTAQPSTPPSAVLSSGSVPVTRIPGLLPIVPGSIPVCLNVVSVHISLIVMVALCNRADHYIFMLLFVLLSSFFSSPNLKRHRLEVCRTSTHG